METQNPQQNPLFFLGLSQTREGRARKQIPEEKEIKRKSLSPLLPPLGSDDIINTLFLRNRLLFI
jgi:hypothetical protein